MSKRRFHAMIGAALVVVLAGTTLNTGPAAAAESRTTITAQGDTITKTAVGRLSAAAEQTCTLWVNGVNWGGQNYCNYRTPLHYFPNGTVQVFVVGTDYAVWTKWRLLNGAFSSWVSLGGQVRRGNPADLGDIAYNRPTVYGLAAVPEVWVYGNTTGAPVEFSRVRNPSTGVWAPWVRH